jgi:hypothetical protein
VSRGRARTGQPNPGAAERARQVNVQAMYDADPPIDISSATWRDDPALSERDWVLLDNFHTRMKSENEDMQDCTRCDKRWFTLDLNRDYVCHECSKADRDLELDMPYLFSAANDLDPGMVPPELQGEYELSQVEEMLIARVHCFVEVRQIRGSQFR